mmetsp:Transcript_92359/g.232860  ORF Transcript_92359/g.232860 Transcript_92359/m.232860 type:complete len:447 (+) Transcript_92359:117-1457(+)
MGCGISSKTTCELETTTTPRHGVSGVLQRKVRSTLRVDDDENSDQEQDANLPKEVMGRDLASMMRDAAPRDHQFFSQDRANFKPAWTKRVQREWRILARGLPDDIHLRLYGDRMDIMRAALVGPKNTPYADALLFFDIHLSPNYPLVPPSVKFWSFGERINPNLYESGLVCLSLLGTWSGSGTEVWCPRKSTVLQVLVSILGLVLVEEPYFNEPGYEKTRGTAQAEVHARQYSEKARLMSLRSMLRIGQNPLGGFEDFAKQHFAEKGEAIVKRVEQFVAASGSANCSIGSGKPPGSAPRGGKKLDGIDTLAASESFRRELAKLLPGLKGMQQKLLAERNAATAAAAAAAAAAATNGNSPSDRDGSTRNGNATTTPAGTGGGAGGGGAGQGGGAGAVPVAKRPPAMLRPASAEKDVVQLGTTGDKDHATLGAAARPHILSSVSAAGA